MYHHHHYHYDEAVLDQPPIISREALCAEERDGSKDREGFFPAADD